MFVPLDFRETRERSRSYCKTDFSVILSEAKDLELIKKTRFFNYVQNDKIL
jgi:hypothetical protein